MATWWHTDTRGLGAALAAAQAWILGSAGGAALDPSAGTDESRTAHVRALLAGSLAACATLAELPVTVGPVLRIGDPSTAQYPTADAARIAAAVVRTWAVLGPHDVPHDLNVATTGGSPPLTGAAWSAVDGPPGDVTQLVLTAVASAVFPFVGCVWLSGALARVWWSHEEAKLLQLHARVVQMVADHRAREQRDGIRYAWSGDELALLHELEDQQKTVAAWRQIPNYFWWFSDLPSAPWEFGRRLAEEAASPLAAGVTGAVVALGALAAVWWFVLRR